MNKLNFGCGDDIRKGWDNADIQKGADIVFDFDEFPYPLKTNHYEYVEIRGVLEHLMKPYKALEEIRKACKHNAEIIIRVPHYSNRSAFDSLYHTYYFSQTAFKYFVERQCCIDKKPQFEIIELTVGSSCVGKWIRPYWLRDKLSLFINGLQSYIYVRLGVVKWQEK